MKPIIYHTGITPPPETSHLNWEVSHYPTIQVEFGSLIQPREIGEFLKIDPVVLIMSKNAVMGLKTWLNRHNLKSDFFNRVNFWTIGEITHGYLQETLSIHSWYPDIMTGEGIIQSLKTQNKTKILLISALEPRDSFITGLKEAGIHFFHFPVYETHLLENEQFNGQFANTSSEFLLVTSPSVLKGILKTLGLENLSGIKANIISIGPTTSAVVRKLKGKVYFESETQNIGRLYTKLSDLIFNHE